MYIFDYEMVHQEASVESIKIMLLWIYHTNCVSTFFNSNKIKKLYPVNSSNTKWICTIFKNMLDPKCCALVTELPSQLCSRTLSNKANKLCSPLLQMVDARRLHRWWTTNVRGWPSVVRFFADLCRADFPRGSWVQRIQSYLHV